MPNTVQPRGQKRPAKKVAKGYCFPDLNVSTFDFQQNIFDNDNTSRKKRKSKHAQQTPSEQDVVIYSSKLQYYQSRSNALQMTTEDALGKLKSMKALPVIHIESEQDSLATLLSSPLFTYIRRRKLSVEVCIHTTELNSLFASLLVRRLLGLSSLTALVIAGLETVDLPKGLDAPNVPMIFPHTKSVTVEPGFTGLKVISASTFPLLENITAFSLTITDLYLDMQKLKCITLVGSKVTNFLVASCLCLESVDLSGSSIKKFEVEEFLPKLKTLDLRLCLELEVFSASNVPSLLSLNLSCCPKLSDLKFLNAPRLYVLALEESAIVSPLPLHHIYVPSLKYFNAKFSGIRSIPSNSPQLQIMDLSDTCFLKDVVNLSLKELAILDLQKSALELLVIKISASLQILNMSGTKGLKSISIQSFKSAELDAKVEDASDILATANNMESGTSFNPHYEQNVEKFSLESSTLKSITHFSVPCTTFLTLSCSSLDYLSLDCKNITTIYLKGSKVKRMGPLNLPKVSTFRAAECVLPSLEELEAPQMKKLILNNIHMNEFNMKPMGLENVTKVELCKLTGLTSIDFSSFFKLKSATIDDCQDLAAVTGNLSATALKISSCPRVRTLLLDCESMETCTLQKLDSLRVIEPDCFRVPAIRMMHLLSCNLLTSCTFTESATMKNLDIADCKELSRIDMEPAKLDKLRISKLGSLVSIPNCISVEHELLIRHCAKLANIKCDLSSLHKLDIRDCESLKGVDTAMLHVRVIIIASCSSFQRTAFSKLPNLKHYTLKNCQSISQFFAEAPEVENIVIKDCRSLVSFNSTGSSLSSLQYLEVLNCPLSLLNLDIFPAANNRTMDRLSLKGTNLQTLIGMRHIRNIVIVDDKLASLKNLLFDNLTSLTLDAPSFIGFSGNGFASLHTLALTNCASLKKLDINPISFPKLSTVTLKRCNIEEMNISHSSLNIECYDLPSLKSLQLDPGSKYRFERCFALVDFANLVDMLAQGSVEFSRLAVALLISRLKTVINAAHRKNVFTYNGSLASSVLFNTDGTLNVSSVQSDGQVHAVASSLISQYQQSWQEPWQVPNPFLDSQTGNGGFDGYLIRNREQYQKFIAVIDLLVETVSKHSSILTYYGLHNYELAQESMLALYFALNVPGNEELIPEKRCYKAYIKERIQQPAFVKAFCRIFDSYRGSEKEKPLVHLKKIILKQLLPNQFKHIRSTLAQRGHSVSVDDLKDLTFTMKSKALLFLSSNNTQSQTLRCPVCFEEENDNNDVDFMFFIACGHNCCSACLSKLKRHVCFICRANIKDGTVSKKEAFGEIALFDKLGRDTKLWEESVNKVSSMYTHLVSSGPWNIGASRDYDYYLSDEELELGLSDNNDAYLTQPMFDDLDDDLGGDW